MKKVSLVLVASIALAGVLFACNQSSNKKVEDATENLTEAESELRSAEIKEKEAAKAKEIVEWNNFKQEANASIVEMENDLKKLEIRVEKSAKNDKQKAKADYEKAKSEIETLKAKLRDKSVEFETDIKSFDGNVSEKNQSFKREFKHDMDEFGNSFRDLFKDNVK